MPLPVTEKAEIMNTYQRTTGDTGSPEVQIALLTARIKQLTPHFEAFHKDNHSRRGLQRMISRRRKLLVYLKKKNFDAYSQLVKQLGLRH